MELISYPHGRSYETDYERHLWNPSRVQLVESAPAAGAPPPLDTTS